MKTNELKKGTRVRLEDGCEAELKDNLKGNIRLAMVFGLFHELGSIYSHDIVGYYAMGTWRAVEHTPAQEKLRKRVELLFGR